MRVLVTGGAGNVAGWMARTVPDGVDLHVTEHRNPVPAPTRSVASVHPVELRERTLVDALLSGLHPDVVVHAAYAPDRRDAVLDASAAVAGASASVGASLVHLSTDVVFAGDDPPYDEDATPDPITDYGRWKAEAEATVRVAIPDACITRTSLVPSLDPPDRATAALVGSLDAGRRVTLFTDEMRQPIRAVDLAAQLWALLSLERSHRSGVWHLPGPEHLSRHEIGLRLASGLGADPSAIAPGRSSDQPVRRPLDPELLGSRWRRLGVMPAPFDLR